MQTALLPVRNRLTRRLFGLHGADVLPLTLVPRRIYILPSRHGTAFMVLLLGMLLGSVNYGLSMGYLFTFLLMGMTLAALFATWRNLVGLTIEAVEAEPAFAGETLRFVFRIANPHARQRHSVAIAASGHGPVHAHIPVLGEARLALSMPARQRGRQALGVCRLYSEYPLGLFHAWAVLDLQTAALVWPRPVGPYPLPVRMVQAVGQGGPLRRGAEDFDGLRAYERGENPARIAWKSLARHEEPLAKGFVAPTSHDLWLAWDALGGLGTEARLSQLARWVLDADRSGQTYGLSLPGQSIPPGCGAAHRTRCLNALALQGGAPA